MTISSNSFIYINVGIVVFFVCMFILGYHKGVVRTLINIFGTLLGLWIASILGPVCADYAHIWNDTWTPLQGTIFTESLSSFLNEMVWFLLVFIIIKIFFAFFEHFTKGVKDIPILGTISGVIGGCLHMVTGLIWMLVVCVMLSLPFVSNGEEVIEGTFLDPIRSTVNTVTNNSLKPWLESQAFDTLIHDASNLQQEQRNVIKEWLESHGYSQDALDEVSE